VFENNYVYRLFRILKNVILYVFCQSLKTIQLSTLVSAERQKSEH